MKKLNENGLTELTVEKLIKDKQDSLSTYTDNKGVTTKIDLHFDPDYFIVNKNLPKDEYKKLVINDPNIIKKLPLEDQKSEILELNLENTNVFKNILHIYVNTINITNKHKTTSLTGIRNVFTDVLKIDIGIREDVINNLSSSYKLDDKKEYFDILKTIVLNDDKGYEKLDKNGIKYIYFLDIENCRKYIIDQGFIQLYSHTGLYNTVTKNKYDYKKSKDYLKRIKILQINQTQDKESYSFDGLEKYYFLDEKNKNYKLTWNPYKDKTYTENGIDYYNEYSPINYLGVDHNKDLSLIYNHIKHFLCSDNEEVYNYFISVISDMVINPGRKLPVSIILNGGGGVGKSFLFDKLFSKLFGEMFGSISNKFPSRFNSVLENKLCFLIEEFSHQDNVNESNILKNYISNPLISIERKGFEPYFSTNCIRFFICSNGEWSVRIENNNSSRRYLVCDVSEEKPDPEHFDKLSELIKGDKRRGFEDENILKETIEQFIFDMGKIDTSVLESDPPETESKKISQSFSKSIPEKQLEGFFEKVLSCHGYYNTFSDCIQILDPDNEYEINSSGFWDCFVEYLKDRRQNIPCGFSNYGRILSKWFGKDYSKLGTKMVDGKRSRVYTFPKMEVVEDIIDKIN